MLRGLVGSLPLIRVKYNEHPRAVLIKGVFEVRIHGRKNTRVLKSTVYLRSRNLFEIFPPQYDCAILTRVIGFSRYFYIA